MGDCQNYGPFWGTLRIGIIGTILGLYRDNGKNGNYYIGVIYTLLVPFWGTLDIRCRIIIGTQKGTIILTTTHMHSREVAWHCAANSKDATLSVRMFSFWLCHVLARKEKEGWSFRTPNRY